MIAAIILAAGQSRRMGRPKLNLPWGETTVIGQVVQVLLRAGLTDLVVVTGGAQAEVKEALAGFPVRLVHNALYKQEEMLTSFQCGLRALGDDCGAVLVCLGDQPQIENSVVLRILDLYGQTESGLIIPSFQMRRGHPWLLKRTYWEEVLSMGSDQSLRDFLNRHQSEIHYLAVDTPTVLLDLDTPDDYRASSPGMPDS